MGAMTKLEAINRMLRAAGEYPVSTIDGGGVNDTILAVQTLDEQVMYACSEKNYWNCVVHTLIPDADGLIKVDDRTIAVDATDRSFHLQTRGRTPTFLYNVGTNTDKFTKPIEVMQQLLVDFEALPTATQFEACDTACRYYQMATVGDVAQDRVLTQQMLQSRGLAKAADARQRDANFMGGSSLNARNARTYRSSGIETTRRGTY